MASNKFVTAEDAERIWFLHNKGLSNTEICGIENRSVHTVNRVVNIYKAVRDTNGVDELPPTYREGYQHLVGYARQHFGVSTTNAAILKLDSFIVEVYLPQRYAKIWSSYAS